MFPILRSGKPSTKSPPRRQSLIVEQLEDRCTPSVDPILEWNANAIEVNRISYSGGVVNDEIGPTRSSRALAIEHVAMFDAWNSIHLAYTPYLVVAPNARGASDEAAVAQAAHDTLLAMYPHQQAFIDAALDLSLARVRESIPKARGIAVGKFIAQAILAARANDGSQVPGDYMPDGLLGHHVADPLNPDQGFLTPAWGAVTPFGLTSVNQVQTRQVPSLSSQEYADALNQVEALGADLGQNSVRTTDQTEIGLFWGYDVARGLGDPPRLYNQIARVIALQEHNTVGENARMFALINIGMADAGIQCWGVKYRDICWRPIVAIREADLDGNPNTIADPTWAPLGAPRSNPLPGETVNFTPPFPSYTSGHATFGGAAFKLMADFYQTDDLDIKIPFDFISDELNGVTRDIHEQIPDLVMNYIREIKSRHYTSFSQAAAENASSRIFLGIHFRFDAIEGVRAGDHIADIEFDRLLRPLHGRSPLHVASVDFTEQIDAYLNNTYQDYFKNRSGDGYGGQGIHPDRDKRPAGSFSDLGLANAILGPTLDPSGVGSAERISAAIDSPVRTIDRPPTGGHASHPGAEALLAPKPEGQTASNTGDSEPQVSSGWRSHDLVSTGSTRTGHADGHGAELPFFWSFSSLRNGLD